MNIRDITAQVLADEFSRELHANLDAGTMRTIIKRNHTAGYLNCCASHDFCDANMVMDAAVNNLTGACMDLDDEVILNLVNEAWEIARLTEFQI